MAAVGVFGDTSGDASGGANAAPRASHAPMRNAMVIASERA